jgi:hypothetical protein
MYDYDGEDEYEGENEPMEKAKSTIEDTTIKLEVSTDVLQRTIIDELHSQLYSSLKASIISDIKAEIMPELKKEVVSHTSEIVKSLVDDVYNNDKITIGGGWDEKKEEVTFHDFVRTEVKKCIDNGSFKDSRGYDIKFSEYITKQCVGGEVERKMNKSIEEIRNSINSNLKALFDLQTKNMLSDTVLKVLMASETYQGIENRVKRLADKN